MRGGGNPGTHRKMQGFREFVLLFFVSLWAPSEEARPRCGPARLRRSRRRVCSEAANVIWCSLGVQPKKFFFAPGWGRAPRFQWRDVAPKAILLSRSTMKSSDCPDGDEKRTEDASAVGPLGVLHAQRSGWLVNLFTSLWAAKLTAGILGPGPTSEPEGPCGPERAARTSMCFFSGSTSVGVGFAVQTAA